MPHSDHLRELHPPTPAWVIDVPVLETFLARFQKALNTYWPHSILGYSFKTNSLPWLISFLRDRGAWAEVVSDTEYQLALRLGYTPDRIVYNGPIKSRELLRSALQGGAIVNLDAKREVIWTAELARETPETELAVGLRINWDMESRCPGESVTGEDEDGRFGFNAENGEFCQALSELTEAGVRIAGLHMHRNSLTQSLNIYRAAASVAAELITSHNLELDWIDIGGGFFGSLDGSPTFDEYVSVIRETLDPVVDVERTCLIVEPGGSLVAVPMEFHSTVLDVKEAGSSTFVVTDASRTDLDPLFRRRSPFETRIEAARMDTHPKQIISGFTCMEDDRLLTLQDGPTLQNGDRIVFHKVGAYTMSYQSMFIEYLPAVYARIGEELIKVREQWGVSEFLQGNRWVENGELVDSDTASVNPAAFPTPALQLHKHPDEQGGLRSASTSKNSMG